VTLPETIHSAIGAQPFFQAIGWSLLHSLWQGTLIGLAYACGSRMLKQSLAGVRHLVGCVALMMMLVFPVATATVLLRSGSISPDPTTSASAPGFDARSGTRLSVLNAQDVPEASTTGEREIAGDVFSIASLRMWIERFLPSVLPWLVVGWFAGMSLLWLRVIGGFFGVHALVRRARPLSGDLEKMVARVARRLRVTRAVRLCESALVEVPTVAGHFKPVILLPASVLTGLSPAQLEAILSHELAHIRRHDYLVNLLQTMVETLLFYHPAAWWVARRVRAEREHASDDIAVACTQDVLLYAGALASLEELRQAHRNTPALALAANGGSLMFRIHRLITRKPARTHASFSTTVSFAITTFGLVAGATTLMPAHIGHVAAAPSKGAAVNARQVAITFVSFPGNNIYADVRLVNKTRKLIRGLREHGVSAVAFVNEARLYKEDGTTDDVRVGLLREWLDAGHELGNETFSHKSLFHISLAEFQADVEQGEKIMSRLLSERGQRLKYFSYPYLNTGTDLAKKAAAEKYLRDRGYSIHPVTIDNMDWLFNRAYLEALRREDESATATIRSEYISYMERMFAFTESYSREVVGREFPQVLMLTAGALNADCLDDLVAMMKKRGYSFVTMAQATSDVTYNLPDNYTGQSGDSWIARWAATKGMEYKDTEEVNLTPYMQKYFAEYKKK
jgi:beta-lactamase regulating signal transducer with metallopeptidase domain